MIDIRTPDDTVGDKEKPLEANAPAPVNSSKRSLLESVRDVAFIAAIYLYFAGFAYEALYYSIFSVRTESEQPIYTYLVYGYNTFEPHLPLVITTMITIAGASPLLSALLEPARWTRAIDMLVRVRSAFVPAAAVLLFPLIFVWARDAAERHAQNVISGQNSSFITLHFKGDPARDYDRAFINENNDTLLFLVSESKDAYYVLRPGARPAPGDKRRGFVYEIPRSDVRYVETITR